MKIRVLPEDFIVEEVINIKFEKKGDYKIYLLIKESLETLNFLNEFSSKYNINYTDIGFCGLKDKHAITTQYISIPSRYNLKDEIIGHNYELTFLGFSNTVLKSGLLEGNNFTLTIRDLKLNEIDTMTKSILEVEKKGIINYYDSQRFGSVVGGVFIGKLLLQKRFEEAVKYFILSQINNSDKDDFENIKKRLFNSDFEKLNLNLPYFLKIKKAYLTTKSYKDAYRSIPAKLREMMINAYQSYLWNECVKLKIEKEDPEFFSVPYNIGNLYFSEKIENSQFALIGRKLDPQDKGIEIINEILKKENLDFQAFKSLSKTGSFLISTLREVKVYPKFVKILETKKDDKYSKEEDKFLIKVSFFLPKGVYATIFIKSISYKF